MNNQKIRVLRHLWYSYETLAFHHLLNLLLGNMFVTSFVQKTKIKIFETIFHLGTTSVLNLLHKNQRIKFCFIFFKCVHMTLMLLKHGLKT